jgi:hypothetical protein
MKDALTIHRALLERETQHEIVRLPIAIARADDLPRALGLPAERCLVTRVLACNDVQRGRRFLAGVIVAAGTAAPPEVVRHAVGARLIRPARADLVNAVTVILDWEPDGPAVLGVTLLSTSDTCWRARDWPPPSGSGAAGIAPTAGAVPTVTQASRAAVATARRTVLTPCPPEGRPSPETTGPPVEGGRRFPASRARW